MTITEKVAYLRGLAEGLNLDDNNKQDKLIKAIIGVLDDMALTVSDLEDGCAELCEQIDAVDEDLSAVEDLIYEDEDYDECDCDCDCADDEVYEIECPNCHDLIYLDQDELDQDIKCPGCGTNLEFEFDDDDGKGGGDCCCGCDDAE